MTNVFTLSRKEDKGQTPQLLQKIFKAANQMKRKREK
jgi:hypothetical protein